MKKAIVVSCILLLFSHSLRADETAPSPCGKSIAIDGDTTHFKLPAGVTVESAPNDGSYDEEVYGKSFSATIAGLPSGTYTVIIDLAEVYRKGPGQRVMKIAVGDTVLTDNLDLFQSAGFAKAYQVKGTISHQDDMMLGPVVIAFTAIKDSAKFNAIHILNDKGEVVACVKASDLVNMDKIAAKIPVVTDPVIYLDPKQPVERRVDDLVRRMSLAEKVGQLGDSARAIPRLSVPEYHYWNECLHGVARAGIATVFPQAIGLASTWNPALAHQEADAIATEGRAHYNDVAAKWQHTNYYGITFWTPNINIFRDPRWGRGQETYGEDPFLTSRIGVSFITGIQGDDPHYYKALACAKHFAVHSGPEKDRDHFNSTPPLSDLYNTYLPQFEAAVKEGHVGCVMSSYNALYGVPNSANAFLLTDTLRKDWGFQGYIVSDCNALVNIWTKYNYAPTAAVGTSWCYEAGLDLECGGSHGVLVTAVSRGLITEAEIDTHVKRLMTARFKLGMFDPPADCPYSGITMAEIDSPAHATLNLEVAHQSMVLLKNDGLLPLDKSKYKRIAVIGPNAQNKSVLQSNYYGEMSHPVYLLDGIKNEAGDGIAVTFAKGCSLKGDKFDANSKDAKEALQAAQNADLIIYVGGIDGGFEGEGYDRSSIELPEVQTGLLQALQATAKPVVFVNCSGSAVAFPWAAAHIPAILQAWYPGAQGGTAVADVLFGKYNPGGRLPVTFYEKTSDLPDLADYSMANRTYRYFTGKALFPFGHGLSYTKFDYLPVTATTTTLSAKDTLHLTVPVKNSGDRDGDEVVQVYQHRKGSPPTEPIRSLVAFQRVTVAKGNTTDVSLDIPLDRFRYWSAEKGAYVIQNGIYDLQIGSSSDDIRQMFEITLQP